MNFVSSSSQTPYRVYFSPARNQVRSFQTASEAEAYVRRFNQAMHGSECRAHLWFHVRPPHPHPPANPT